MPRFVKRNDNGPLPGCPNDDDAYERTLDRAVREHAEDADFQAAEAARRSGQVSTRRAPWLRPQSNAMAGSHMPRHRMY